MTPSTTAARCIHGRQDCAACARFSAAVATAVVRRESAWRPGILATLNRASAVTTASNRT